MFQSFYANFDLLQYTAKACQFDGKKFLKKKTPPSPPKKSLLTFHVRNVHLSYFQLWTVH